MRKIYGNIPTGAALRHQPNFRLTCICAFAIAKRKAKLAQKLHQKGAASAANIRIVKLLKDRDSAL